MLRFKIWFVCTMCISAFLFLRCADNQTKHLQPTFHSIQARVFDVHCALSGCHVGSADESQLNLEEGRAYHNLVNVQSVGIPDIQRVNPHHPEESYLIRKLQGTKIVGERMPLGKSPLPDSVIQVIKEWIEKGALDN